MHILTNACRVSGKEARERKTEVEIKLLFTPEFPLTFNESTGLTIPGPVFERQKLQVTGS